MTEPTEARVWTYSYTTMGSTCQGSIPCDGFNAVGNFDADPEGEVVIVRLGEVFVINHDGTLLHQVTDPVGRLHAKRERTAHDRGLRWGRPTGDRDRGR